MRVDDLPVEALGRLVHFDTDRQTYFDQVRGATARANEIRHSLAYSREQPTPAQEAELTALDNARAKAQWMHDQLHGLTSNLKQWLHGLPKGTVLEMAEVPPNPVRKGETLEKAINRVRGEIVSVGNRLDVTKHAPRPKDERKADAAEIVRQRAALGRPRYDERGGHLVPDHVDPTKMDRDTVFVDVLNYDAWKNPDAVLAAYHRDIDAMPDPVDAMPTPERISRVGELSAALLELERQEEHLIERAAGSGLLIERRTDASPAAVLNVRVGARRAAVAA
jgi:hypothetical protein